MWICFLCKNEACTYWKFELLQSSNSYLAFLVIGLILNVRNSGEHAGSYMEDLKKLIFYYLRK